MNFLMRSNTSIQEQRHLAQSYHRRSKIERLRTIFFNRMLIFKRFAYYVAIPKPYGYGQYVVQPHCILFDYAPYALIPISGVFVSTSAFPQQISIRRTWIKRLCIYGKINDTKNRKQQNSHSTLLTV